MTLHLELKPRLRFYSTLIILLVIWVRIGILRFLRPFMPASSFKKVAHRVHERNARHVYRMILKRKGLMIKVGQFMSLRVDLLPRTYTEILSKLQDQVPPAPLRRIRRVFLEELGSPPEEIFQSFSPHPIAAASLGQVHEACLSGGTKVAVKVQYPGIDKIVQIDLRILKLILRFWKKFRKAFDSERVLTEFQTMVTQELDYLHEGANAERMAKLFSNDRNILIPRVIWPHTTRRILVMEYLEGIKVTDLDSLRTAGIDIKMVSERVVDCYLRQVIRHGFFQADAHPGNIFVQPGPKIVLLDFGLCKELSPEFLKGFGKLAVGLIQRDPSTMRQAFLELGFRSAAEDEKAFERFSEVVILHTREVMYKHRKKIPYLKIFQEIAEIVQAHPIVSIPNEFILIGRVLAQLMGLGRLLGQNIEVDQIAIPYLIPSPARSEESKE